MAIWYVVAPITGALLAQNVDPVGRNCTIYDDTVPPPDGACHDTVIVVAVVFESESPLTCPGAGTLESAPGIAANATVPPE